MSRLATMQASWRPALGWATVAINLLYSGGILLLLLTGACRLEEAVSFMMAQIAQLGMVGSVTAAGRSWEKRHGMSGAAAPGPGPQLPNGDDLWRG